MGKRVLFSESHGEPTRTKESVLSTIMGIIEGVGNPYETLDKILLRFNYKLKFSGAKKLTLQYLRNFELE